MTATTTKPSLFSLVKPFFAAIRPAFDATHVAEAQLQEARRERLIALRNAEEAQLHCEYHRLCAAMYEVRAKRIEGYGAVEDAK